ncbi:XrtA/PEP-CTERM system histidine kinase PrsK [Sphingomonas sp. Mn802worker]|uniref:XrtA/PEP-CTERM system histidine kinase PrsK n=1 Tax=Sphingomonas sp. Mn802worker TaxID=629773 RepID=UPI00039C68B5|nr:XrtA/PEP-CTERM system histidine kinase PrsK [Sphingomonas sp. Mn802worker]
MTVAAFIIWLHGLAALLFCGAFVAEARSPIRAVPRWLLLFALGSSALWAISIAGIGDGEIGVRMAVVARNLAWIATLYVLSSSQVRGRHWRLGVYVAAAGCLGFAVMVAVSLSGPPTGQVHEAGERVWLILRLLSTIGALMLLHQHVVGRDQRWSEAAAMLSAAMALIWACDLIVLAIAYAAGGWADWLTVLRGFATVLAALATVIAVHRRAERAISISRTATAQAFIVVGGMAYITIVVAITALLGQIAGSSARVFQAAFVVGSGTALFTFVATPWLRAWSKVMIAKHLFSHRYDYRTEWMRFTDTLGVSGEDVAPLPDRAIQAIANLTGSPAGLLLYVEGGEMVAGPAWRWDEAAKSNDTAALIVYLERSGRIIDLDACRGGDAGEDERAAVPTGLLAREDAWAVVPLLRAETLIGAVVLARPPVARALDWEDFDLLGAAGRQAASYLAEERAQAALADTKRFDEFNRRFAFIMHDLKNLVSQTALVARNAERHADNPAFRADMIVTLQDTSQRMTALLARLSQHRMMSADALAPVDLLGIAHDIAASRAAQHAVTVTGAPAWVLADGHGLRTLLDHLVQNAIEASAGGQVIRLHVEDGARTATITIIDQGSGMSPDFVRDALFKPFASNKPGGFGLGAYEARQMAEQMGGSITVQSQQREGSSFRVELPLAAAAEAAGAPPLEQAA